MTVKALQRRTRLAHGAGAYISDILPHDTLYAAFVRSYEAFAEVRDVDLSECLEVEGVVAAYSWQDLKGVVGPLRNEGPGLAAYDWTALADRFVHYVGEPVAMIVATSPYIAEDALERAVIDLEPLPTQVDPLQAMEQGPFLHPEIGTNVLFERSLPDEGVAAVLADADVVVTRTMHLGRQTPFPLETRGVLARREDGTGNLAVWTSTQIPHLVRTALSTVLGRPEESVRVITPDVGGGFGLKANVFAEEILVAAAATLLPRPVCWIEDRRENLIASGHAHDEYVTITLGARRDGTILAADIDVVVDVGAHSTYPFSASLEPMTTLPMTLATYAVPRASVRTRGVSTPKCAVGPYRGVGGPAASYATERILDVLAHELGMDPADVRRRNLVRPEQMPYVTAQGVPLDSGDYPAAFEKLLQAADYDGLRRYQAEAAREGKRIGIGFAVFNEHSGPGSRAYRRRGIASVPGFDAARMAMDPDGCVTVYASSAEAGQDHSTSYELIASRELMMDTDLIRVVTGDTGLCPAGTGTFASRNGTAQLSAVYECARQLRSRLVDVAAVLLGCEAADVVLRPGGFATADGTAEVDLLRVARAAHLRIPDFVAPEGFSPGLEATSVFDPELPTYPYGAHLSVVEVDPEVLSVRLLKHVAFEDCGVVVNEAAVHEQIVGGIVTGIGNALFEEVLYDQDGQVKTSTILDYLVPLAVDVPPLTLLHGHTPSDRTPMGTKGVAEAGTIGAVGAIGAAVADALHHMGAGELNELPVTVDRLYACLADAGIRTLAGESSPVPAP